MSDEVSETRVMSRAAKIVLAYGKAVPGSTTGLHDHIARAPLPPLFTSTTHDEVINRINCAIGEWERWSLRPPGPRVVSFDEVSGEVEMR
jgi:hypothetical protein